MRNEEEPFKIFIMRSILLNYSQPMRKGSKNAYHYDYNEKLNVVADEEGVVMPFVDSKLDQLCISTKTRAEMESDDEGSFIYK